MSVLNKLLGMLDQLKEENPELANKALLAAETLKAGASPEDLEGQWEEDVEQTEEEEFDDSYVVLDTVHTTMFVNATRKLDEKLTDYGTYMRDHEVRKNIMLEEIEQIRYNNEKMLQKLREEYSLDPNSAYTLELEQDNTGNLAFVKQ